ncbi:unnamed protein product [Durusdinium trenchii]|uniref:Nuclear pore complex protein Nup85 n=2 Tax=Durusdinium trenchii TaxID=1381693 RepID=A0ABP0SDA5_9DINO
MALWREALWTTIRRWQLTPERPTFLAIGLHELQQGFQEGQRAEVAFWLLSKYGGREVDPHLRQAAVLTVRAWDELLTTAVAAQQRGDPLPLMDSALKLLEAAPTAEALPLLLDDRLAPFTALPSALAASAAASRVATASVVATASTAERLQQRALNGETGLVQAAAELLEDARPLAQQWAKLCAEASASELPSRARALVACMVRAELCQLWWRDCAQVLGHVPLAEQVHFVLRVAHFAVTASQLLQPALQLWLAVWPAAEGDEDLVLALEKLVQVSARSNAECAPALQALCRSLASASSWAPQTVSAALGTVEASVTPSGATPWPLTQHMVSFYGPVLQCAASISATQSIPLGLVGALVSWDATSDLGLQLRGALLSNEQAVRTLCNQSEENRTTLRIKEALGL